MSIRVVGHVPEESGPDLTPMEATAFETDPDVEPVQRPAPHLPGDAIDHFIHKPLDLGIIHPVGDRDVQCLSLIHI